MTPDASTCTRCGTVDGAPTVIVDAAGCSARLCNRCRDRLAEFLGPRNHRAVRTTAVDHRRSAELREGRP